MYLKQLYKAFIASLVVSANTFAAGDMSPDLAGFFEGNGGIVSTISTVRLANPNDPTFAGCRLNFAGQVVEFDSRGGEVKLRNPIRYDDQITSRPAAPYLQRNDDMTLVFAETVGITRKGYEQSRDLSTTISASTELPISVIVVRLSQILPTLAEIGRQGIQPAVPGTESATPQFNYSQIAHLVRTGSATECYPSDSEIVVKGSQLQNAFSTGCLELSFEHALAPIGYTKLAYDKVASNTDLQLPYRESVEIYRVTTDVSHNLSVHSGNYASELVCNN